MLNLESCSQLESALLKLKEISKLEVSKFEAGNEKIPNEKYQLKSWILTFEIVVLIFVWSVFEMCFTWAFETFVDNLGMMGAAGGRAK